MQHSAYILYKGGKKLYFKDFDTFYRYLTKSINQTKGDGVLERDNGNLFLINMLAYPLFFASFINFEYYCKIYESIEIL